MSLVSTADQSVGLGERGTVRPRPLSTLEKPAGEVSGTPVLIVGVLLIATGIGWLIWGRPWAADAAKTGGLLAGIGPLLILLGAFSLSGLTAVVPGEAQIVQLFGRYLGTIRADGLHWVIPLSKRRKVSVKIRNHETSPTKVNDANGIPIEIAAVVVWQVHDTARAVYEVEDFAQFVLMQSETAVRHVATTHPYDAHEERRPSLLESVDAIAEELRAEISDRVARAGVSVIESRITRLSYAPEIAQVMLQRQQAGAVVAARKQIVEGAVGMVELALDRLAKEDIVELDEERKAAMVSNLLVVLCGDRGTQPVVNTGSLYH